MTETASKRTTDHETIRRWVEERGGEPARVKGTAEDGDAGVLRIAFPDQSTDGDELEPMDWGEFFRSFDEKRLAFLYQERAPDGETSKFNKFTLR